MNSDMSRLRKAYLLLLVSIPAVFVALKLFGADAGLPKGVAMGFLAGALFGYANLVCLRLTITALITPDGAKWIKVMTGLLGLNAIFLTFAALLWKKYFDVIGMTLGFTYDIIVMAIIFLVLTVVAQSKKGGSTSSES